MKKINLNTLAREVAKREGKKINLSIAQVKEVVAHTLDLLAESDHYAVMDLLDSRCDKPKKPAKRSKR